MIKKLSKTLTPLLILTFLVISGVWYWHHKKLYPSTDDAYIHAHVVNIAPQISGDVAKVFVHNHELVKKGELLFTINATPFKIALQKAKAQVDSTKNEVNAADMAVQSAKAMVRERGAELVDTKADTKRELTLVHESFESKSQGDLAIKNLHVARAALDSAIAQLKQAEQKRGELGSNNAQLRAAEAEVAQAKLNLHYTKVYAPGSGHIANFDLRPGDKVSAYQAIFALIEDRTWWAEANFKETQLARIQPGETAEIQLDMYPDKTFRGKVVSISDGSGTSFSLLPPENASGNWVKVTQRFPIKILLSKQQKAFPYRLGASATVTIDTRSLKK